MQPSYNPDVYDGNLKGKTSLHCSLLDLELDAMLAVKPRDRLTISFFETHCVGYKKFLHIVRRELDKVLKRWDQNS